MCHIWEKEKKKKQIYQKVTKVAPSTGYLLYVEYTVGFILNFATCSVVDKPCDQFLGLVWTDYWKTVSNHGLVFNTEFQ